MTHGLWDIMTQDDMWILGYLDTGWHVGIRTLIHRMTCGHWDSCLVSAVLVKHI